MTFQEIYDKILSLNDVMVETRLCVLTSSHEVANSFNEYIKTCEDPKRNYKCRFMKDSLLEALNEIEKGNFKPKRKLFKSINN